MEAAIREKQQYDRRWASHRSQRRLRRRAGRERIVEECAADLNAADEEPLIELQQRMIIRTQLREQKEEEAQLLQWHRNKYAKSKFVRQNQLLYNVEQSLTVLSGERYLTWALNPDRLTSNDFWEEQDSNHSKESWQILYELATEAAKGRRQAKERAVLRPEGPRRWPYPVPRKDESREVRRAEVQLRDATRRAARLLAARNNARLLAAGNAD